MCCDALDNKDNTLLYSPALISLTSIFGPLQDGRDLVALLRLADSVASRCTDSDGVQVGFHATQIRCGGRCTVWDLEVHTVGLHTHK